jgi:hypothetical protein
MRYAIMYQSPSGEAIRLAGMIFVRFSDSQSGPGCGGGPVRRPHAVKPLCMPRFFVSAPAIP